MKLEEQTRVVCVELLARYETEHVTPRGTYCIFSLVQHHMTYLLD